MSRTRLYALALTVIMALIGLLSVVPVASAQTIPSPQQTVGYDPGGRCGPLPAGIQMTSGIIGGPLALPTTTTSVDPCTLSYLRGKGDPARVRVLADSSVPGFFVPILKQAVVAHAGDLWQKGQGCPHPERGVSFTIMTPSLWSSILSFGYDAFEELHPTLACA